MASFSSSRCVCCRALGATAIANRATTVIIASSATSVYPPSDRLLATEMPSETGAEPDWLDPHILWSAVGLIFITARRLQHRLVASGATKDRHSCRLHSSRSCV